MESAWPKVSIEDLARLFRVTRHTSRWLAPLALRGDYSLPGRVRGAWGRQLQKLTEIGNYEAHRCRAVLFPDKVNGARGYPPYLIAVDLVDEVLFVSVTLIGTGGQFANIAFGAMEAALGQNPGLDFGNSDWRPLKFISSSYVELTGVPIRKLGSEVHLDFITPLKIGPEKTLGTNFSDVIFSIADRASNLARHESLNVAIEKSVWRDLAKRQTFDPNQLRAIRPFDARSSFSGLKQRMGYVGRLTIVRPTQELSSLLAIGQLIHAGAHVSEGFGRFVY